MRSILNKEKEGPPERTLSLKKTLAYCNSQTRTILNKERGGPPERTLSLKKTLTYCNNPSQNRDHLHLL